MKPLIVFFLLCTASFVYACHTQQANIPYSDSRIESLFTLISNPTVLIALICFVSGMTTLFVYLLIKLKRQSLNHHIALMEADKKIALLQLQLKEAHTTLTQFERYEVLSDYHLKEMELIEKSKDLDLLCMDRDYLDKEVTRYRQKIEAYEVMAEKEKDANVDTFNVIMEDLKRLLNKQPESALKNEYLQQLNGINKSFIDILRKKSEGNLSLSYLKYCICFAIGMSISDVAKLFSIEPSSVYMIRYRLRKNIKLGNDNDFGLFFKKYAFQ